MAVRAPSSTYRLQLNGQFTFNDASRLVAYLSKLGITDIYVSPLMQSRRGSTHGYDVTDPTRLDPELGAEGDFDSLVNTLKEYDMGLLLDIVPNHMAASPENPWWRDIEEKGKASLYYEWFDLDWLSFDGAVDSEAGHRKFFDIAELAGVRVEDEGVFDATHSLVMRLIAEDKVSGLRIDHIDGLYNPLEYLVRLRDRIKQVGKTEGFYILVEKILADGESLPEAWPVSGTTGYEFATALNRFFVNGEGMPSLDGTYRDFTGEMRTFPELVYDKKKQVVVELFSREMDALGGYLASLARQNGLSIAEEDAVNAVTEITARLPVYRTYITNFDVSFSDRASLGQAFKGADMGDKAIAFSRQVLLMEFLPGTTLEQKNNRLQFIMRWQQLTGAIMAKGFEDTALYDYGRLISLNEVGGDPGSVGMTMAEFHYFNIERARACPHSLNATSTHDTKRSGDVRARISVLSELPDEWREHLNLWKRLNEGKKISTSNRQAPDAGTEIFIYQTMLGAWPLTEDEIPEFKERLKTYTTKAMREAKSRTNWLRPNLEYETAVLSFIDRLFDAGSRDGFIEDFRVFERDTAYYGMLNSLSQALLKMTLPGVPDIYRGTELWDFSLVDPDNRRPVDFHRQETFMDELIRTEADIRKSPGTILSAWRDGRIKMYLIWKALNFRKDNAELFQRGEYIPLEASGALKQDICAFLRKIEESCVLVIAPRFFTRLVGTEGTSLNPSNWEIAF